MGSFGALTKCLKKYYATLTVIESLDGLLVYSVRPDFSTSPDVTLDWKVKTLYICPHQEVFPYTGSLSPCYSCTGQTNFIQQQTLSNTLKPLFCQHRPRKVGTNVICIKMICKGQELNL